MDLDYRIAYRTFRYDYLTRLLRRTKGNVSHAQDESGLARSHLYRMLDETGIDVTKFRQPNHPGGARLGAK